VIAHVILFRPKSDLSDADRAALFDSMRAAHRQIEGITRFAVGVRVKNGRPYEALTRDFPYFALLEFETPEAFNAYLAHPLHDDLGARFYRTSEAAEAYDFAVGEMPGALEALQA
jgi:hypothetical protein